MFCRILVPRTAPLQRRDRQQVIHLRAGGRIQIGETEIVYDDGTYNSGMGATMITDNSGTSLPKRPLRSPPEIARRRDCSKRSKARGLSWKRSTLLPQPLSRENKQGIWLALIRRASRCSHRRR